MITLVGTGHVFDLSQILLNILEQRQPDIVCIELDKQRYNAMMRKRMDPEIDKKARKNVPIAYKLLAKFQDNIAEKYGVVAGDEMLTAINYAQSRQLPLAFIDMDAQNLFARMFKSMPLSEKFKLFLMGFGGFFVNKKNIEKELSKFEEDFDSYIKQIGDKFPTIKRILIDERNKYMSRKLMELDKEYDTAIALVGDGHVPGMSKLLRSKGVKLEIIRLKELRSKEIPDVNSSTASFTVECKGPVA